MHHFAGEALPVGFRIFVLVMRNSECEAERAKAGGKRRRGEKRLAIVYVRLRTASLVVST